jgi:hypothetical protein
VIGNAQGEIEHFGDAASEFQYLASLTTPGLSEAEMTVPAEKQSSC